MRKRETIRERIRERDYKIVRAEIKREREKCREKVLRVRKTKIGRYTPRVWQERKIKKKTERLSVCVCVCERETVRV